MTDAVRIPVTIVIARRRPIGVDETGRGTHTEDGDAVSEPLRIVLVDDHATVRHALRLMLEREPDFEVVAEASDGAEALERARRVRADVFIMDLSMPGTSGLIATRRLRELRPDLAIVILTRHTDRTYLQELLRAGTDGYVLKRSPHDELLRAIRAVAAGQQYVDPALTRHLAAPFARQERDQSIRVSPVTDRESQVLRLVSVGYSNKEIAAQLNLSVKTIELHKSNGMQKLGLQGRIELLRYAIYNGWLQDA
jgi:DNA-binding NarL/FixJ family response regulator